MWTGRDADAVHGRLHRRLGQAGRLGAEDEREPRNRFRPERRQRSRLGMRREGDCGETGRMQLGDEVVTVRYARIGDAEHPPHRRAHRLAVQRVAAVGREEHGVGFESGGMAEDRAYVVRVDNVLERDDSSTAGQERSRFGQHDPLR